MLNNSTSSAISEEIAKFDALSDEWWNPNGALKTLHHINPARIAFIESLSSLKDKKVVDVGCGGGILTEGMALRGSQATGIDLSSKAITSARQHAQASQLAINYQEIAIEDFCQSHANTFDIVTCMEMLEHTHSPEQIIMRLAKLTKPNGFVFVSTINRNLHAYLTVVLAAEYLLRLLPRGTHEYERFIKPSELVHWAAKAGLKCISMKGLDYNPFKHTACLTSNIKANYLIAFRKEA